jgi:hypothetical protein
MKRALLLLLVLPLAAWDAKPLRLEKRLAELALAWKNLDAKAVELDKLARAKQRKPAWVGKAFWQETFKDKTYSFGAGSVQGMKSQTLAIQAAENRATVEIIKERMREGAGWTAPPKVDAEPVDWYRDEASDTVHALVVEARAR